MPKDAKGTAKPTVADICLLLAMSIHIIGRKLLDYDEDTLSVAMNKAITHFNGLRVTTIGKRKWMKRMSTYHITSQYLSDLSKNFCNCIRNLG